MATMTVEALVPPQQTSDVSLQQIRNAIPKHCFQPSTFKSMAYIVWDLSLAAGLMGFAHEHIPTVGAWPIRYLLWAAYGYVEGLIFTGIWILGHECGHGALFSSRTLCDFYGFILHTLVLVPFFSWKYTHARHHRYTNHMEKDTVFVPNRETEPTWLSRISKYLGHTEDAPLAALVLLIGHQLVGFPAYLLAYISAGVNSTPVVHAKSNYSSWSHLDPSSPVFTASESFFVGLSTAGIALIFAGLSWAAQHIGWINVMLLYGVPYLWVNNWLIAITYLHHTHPDVHHFETGRWTYLDGALGTVDRPYGFIGRHVFHGIIDSHVIHHLFPRIPFYYAEEATEAIKPILGDRYTVDETPFWLSLWRTFRGCSQVSPVEGQPGVLKWKSK